MGHLHSICLLICSHFAEAIEFLLSRLEHYNDLLLDLSEQSRDKNKGKAGIEAIKLAKHDFGVILERFANSQPMQPILDAVAKIYADAREDEELRSVSSSPLFFARGEL